MVILIIALIGASASGFFLYKSSTSRQSPTTNDPSVASSENDTMDSDASSPRALTNTQPVAADAGSLMDVTVGRPVDASVAIVSVDANAAVVTTPVDAAAVDTPIDAAIPEPIDANVIVTTSPSAKSITDAAHRPTASTAPAQSGRVIDPELSRETGDGVETVTLTIQSRPPGAFVYRTHDKLRLGKTPLEYITKKFNANEDFALKLKGYYDVTFKMSTNRNGKRVELLLSKPKR